MQDLTNTMVTLKQGESDEPLVFIHPIGGNLFIYKALVLSLTTDSPIYGIQDFFDEGKFRDYETLADQARYYVQILFENLGSNCITLAGLSSGGTLAFEMARQCLEYGVKIKKVLLFDTWIKAPFDQKFKNYFEKIILRQMEKLQLTHLLKDHDTKVAWLNFLWKRMGLLLNYIPQPVMVPSVLFTAQEGVPEYTVDPSVQYAWGKFVSSLQVIPVKGNHETIFDLEYLDELCCHVNMVLA